MEIDIISFGMEMSLVLIMAVYASEICPLSEMAKVTLLSVALFRPLIKNGYNTTDIIDNDNIVSFSHYRKWR